MVQTPVEKALKLNPDKLHKFLEQTFEPEYNIELIKNIHNYPYFEHNAPIQQLGKPTLTLIVHAQTYYAVSQKLTIHERTLMNRYHLITIHNPIKTIHQKTKKNCYLVPLYKTP